MSLLFLAGCLSAGEFDALLPKVAFNRLQLQAIDWERIDVDFVFAVDNPSGIEVKPARFDYALGFSQLVTAEGEEAESPEHLPFLDGGDPDGLSITEGLSEIALPVGIDFVNLYELVTAPTGADSLGFGIAGNIGWDTEIGPVDIHYDEAGPFPALRVPEINVREVAVGSIDLEKVSMSVGLNVANDHGSALQFKNLDYRVKVAGTKAVSGLVQDVGSAAGAGTTRIDFPIQLEYARAADIIAAIAGGDKVSIALEGTTDVETPFGVVQLSVDDDGNVRVGTE